jgi:hypothetical protein
MVVRREIESNDGQRVVELRRFESVRSVKLLSRAEDVRLELGPPDSPILESLPGGRPDDSKVPVSATAVAEALLGPDASAVTGDPTARALLQVDPISGKSVRITFVDGLGVQTIEPVGCTLSAWERDFLFQATLSPDAALRPGPRNERHGTKNVEASRLADYFLISTYGTVSGTVIVDRAGPPRRRGPFRRPSVFRLQAYGQVSVRWDDQPGRSEEEAGGHHIAFYLPQGTARFGRGGSHAKCVELEGPVTWYDLPERHLLFETQFTNVPELTVRYGCTVRQAS